MKLIVSKKTGLFVKSFSKNIIEFTDKINDGFDFDDDKIAFVHLMWLKQRTKDSTLHFNNILKLNWNINLETKISINDIRNAVKNMSFIEKIALFVKIFKEEFDKEMEKRSPKNP